MYAHGTSGEDLPHSLHRLQDGARQSDAPRSVYDVPCREGKSNEESPVHSLLHRAAVPHASSALHRMCVALRISLSSGALHGRIVRTSHGLPEGPVHGLQPRLRNTNPQGSVHGLPSGVRDKVCLAEPLCAASGSVHADDLQAARRVPSGARPNVLPAAQLFIVLGPDLHGLRRLSLASDSKLTQRAGQLDQPVSYSRTGKRDSGVFSITPHDVPTRSMVQRVFSATTGLGMMRRDLLGISCVRLWPGGTPALFWRPVSHDFDSVTR